MASPMRAVIRFTEPNPGSNPGSPIMSTILIATIIYSITIPIALTELWIIDIMSEFRKPLKLFSSWKKAIVPVVLAIVFSPLFTILTPIFIIIACILAKRG